MTEKKSTSGEEQYSNTQSRRKYLKSLGIAAAGTGILSQRVNADSKVDLKVNLFTTSAVPESARTAAESAVSELADVLGTGHYVFQNSDLDFEVNQPATYLDVLDQFRSHTEDSSCEGYLNPLLYTHGVEEDRTCGCRGKLDATAYLGAINGYYRQNLATRFCVNSHLNALDNTLYKNVVKHEMLHGLMDPSNSPSGDDDHTYGNTYEGVFGEYYATPMMTGYVESVSNNAKPGTSCSGDEPVQTDYHNGEPSSCAKEEAKRWLKEEY